jgi:hypothetical protein
MSLRLIPPSPTYTETAINSISACAETFNAFLMSCRRVKTSATVLIRTTLATLGQLGTMTAAAKYGMNPNDPTADRGIRKLRNSAVTARPHSSNAS